ncbi:MAG: cation-translocating P-type ATPase [Oscillospiraceae bacterium]
MTDENDAKGLTSERAKELLVRFGSNELTPKKRDNFFKKALHIVCEPMFLLLIAAAVIYFILGEPRDGAIMLVCVLAMIGIDIVQEWKTDRTLAALRDLSAPHIVVFRDGSKQTIASTELVPGDLMMIQEGVKIPADGVIDTCFDLCIDESSLTGEAEGVWKTAEHSAQSSEEYWRSDYVYAGTLVTQGSASIIVDKTGAQTEYGRIGVSVASSEDLPTPLQKQTGSLVKTCAGIAAVLFALVGFVTYFNTSNMLPADRITASILSGITLAMAMIPEEFPVIMTVFLSMGAWRLAKKNSLVRRLPSVETLGAVSVLCVDKTGTITMNRMTVQNTWAQNKDTRTLCETMGLGCETDPYDPMEKSMLEYCEGLGITKEQLFSGELLAEYPFTDALKMMGHVWFRDDKITAALKGSPERILGLCDMLSDKKEEAERKVVEMSGLGLRVIAVAAQTFESDSDIPSDMTCCRPEFLGLVGLADPPRESVARDIATCNEAGIRVVMITGDSGITASSIAKKIGMKNCDNIITGDKLEKMSDEELCEAVKTVSVFSRVIPEHKMRIVKAFQRNGETVAMTGDGVNDAPALKYADIGIAMGGRGSEVSREAADLILLDDNFSTIVDTVRDGRRIYDNIRKAVGYVFTIHIPIALASLLAPILGIAPGALLLLPLHVVLLELLIDPTCSIVLERQPAETDIMSRPPRDPKAKLLNVGTLVKSVIQGLVIFASSFGTYWYLYNRTGDAPLARSFGLAVIMLANLFLVQVNSSTHDYAFRSAVRLARDRVMWAVNIGTVALLLAILYTPLCGFLKLAPLSGFQLLCALLVAGVSVLWYDLVKLANNIRARRR